MPTLEEYMARENTPRTTPREKRTVRLTSNGGFIRAYGWSAWLLKRIGSTLQLGLDSSGGGKNIFVGFPPSSHDKFAPEGIEVTTSDDGMKEDWILKETQFPPEDEYDKLDEEYAKWCEQTLETLVTKQESKKQKKEKKENTEKTERPQQANRQETRRDDQQEIEPGSAHPLRLTDIARQILRFRMQEHSPEDCQRFIGGLQNEILQLL